MLFNYLLLRRHEINDNSYAFIFYDYNLSDFLNLGVH